MWLVCIVIMVKMAAKIALNINRLIYIYGILCTIRNVLSRVGPTSISYVKHTNICNIIISGNDVYRFKVVNFAYKDQECA